MAISKFLEKQQNAKSVEFEVNLLSPDEAMVVPTGALDFKIRALRGDELVGRRTFQVSVMVNGKEAQSLRAVAQVDAQAEIVTANRFIKPDETISPEDVSVSRIQVPAGATDFMFDIEHVIGKRAVRGLSPDRPIRGSGISHPYIVRKGDRVTIEAKRGGLMIHAVGLTKSSGQAGQLITVTNQDSGKDLRAKVTGPGTVEVEF
jgi:flagella basal body P-ring formation protein FlgA